MAAPHRRDAGKKPDDKRPASRRCPTCNTKYPLDFVVCPKDATRLEKPDIGDDPFLGEILAGTFCITGLVGEGAMGRVYEAEHTRLPRRFAIKLMHEELLKYPDAIARVEREAQAIARVTSDHVIQIIDLVRLPDGRPCLITELLEGEELADVLDRSGKLSIADALTIGRQVCRGLSAAHAVGVLHRDLKPSNLFVVKRPDDRPFVKILDFGIAKLSDGAQITVSGMVLGTPAYMAPEQARGDLAVDARADVYSVGAVLYHMLTGSPPYVGDDPAVLLARVASEDPPPPRSIERSLPEAIDRLVMRALSRAPIGRPHSLRDLEREIDAVEAALRPADDRASTAGGRDTVIDAPATPAPPPATAQAQLPPAAAHPIATAPANVAPRILSTPAPRPRFSPSATNGLAAGFAMLVGAIVLDAATLASKLAAPRGKIGATETIVAFVIAAIGAATVGGLALREAAARSARPHAVSKLGSALATASIALLAAMGIAAILLAVGESTGIAPDGRTGLKVQLFFAVTPLLVGLAVFAAGLREAPAPRRPDDAFAGLSDD